jgi:PIN domain nuclease of toxin-antitoxin system
VKLLLDTCTFLWMMAEDERLGSTARRNIVDPANDLILSAASSWEISIKFALGRLRLPQPPEAYVPSRMERSGISGLSIEHDHVLATAGLPAHHRDPFDRLLVAQCQIEGIAIITPDPTFALYAVTTIW